ncbi:MAG TPA: GAF domain-containing protein [Pyrinomonadaceae bacterium]|jgi:GAF domain-containing protein|nr:GAF domain-containing protein [Pyrinomonadaceae bacterium]
MTTLVAKKKAAKKGTAAKKKALKKKAFKSRDGAPKTAKSKLYASLVVQLLSLLKGEHDFIANAANFSALLFNSLPNVNWAGFYFLREDELVLGPFQGNPACVRIPMGKGVCGVAAQQCETIIVPNVHEFPGHIACDVASNSEIVVPLFDGERLLGVLDLDSPLIGRFDDQDAEGLNELATVFVAHEEGLGL